MATGPESGTLERVLRERLRCAHCGYDLGGLSIVDQCPECGVPISATLLAAVDPDANEFRPLLFARGTAIGLVLWSTAALVAALAVLALRVLEASGVWLGLGSTHSPALAWAAVLALAVSGLGSIALVYPHGGLGRWRYAAAAAGLLCYGPMVWLMHRVLVRLDPLIQSPVFGAGGLPADRAVYRLFFGVAAIVCVLGLRLNARALAARSVLLRRGDVSRQTMLAIAGALTLAALGDAAVIASRGAGALEETVRLLGTVLVVVGSLLVTLGLVGVVQDTIRLYPAIRRPPLALDDISHRVGLPRKAGGR